MRISLDWLRDLVAWDVESWELAERLTLAGLNVESVEPYNLKFPGVVVGKVLAQEKHPDADRLSVCRVDAGTGEPFQVVCGAPNVRAGLSVLFASVGTELPNGLVLKKARLRGVESHGMICSASEVGLGEQTDGIMELTTDASIGTPADDLFGYQDTVLDIEVTPNRPDWLCHFGVAREVAAIFGTKVVTPDLWTPQRGDGGGIKVEIEDFADCPRYMAHVVRDVRIGAAPNVIQNRLRALGARPVNNIVDITNYVMLETGQPLHAFDRKKITGESLRVCRAGQPTEVVTLDGSSRRLEPDDLVIADGEHPVAIAGVMGLRNSEVDDETTDLVLESAYFAPALVRHTSRRLGLVSESSYRFEREADWEAVEFAARRAVLLLQEYAGAEAVVDWTDRNDLERKPREPIPLRVYQVNRVLGAKIGAEEAAEALQAYGLKVQPMGVPADRGAQAVDMMINVPSFRRDLREEVDLIEEIARSHGYDRITKPGRFRGGAGGRVRPEIVRERRLRHHLISRGYTEIVTSSFVSCDAVARLALATDDPRREGLTVRNPRHGGDVVLRTTLLPSLLDVARRNLNADAPVPLRFFQIDRVYRPDLGSASEGRREAEKRLPGEIAFLQLGIAGWEERGLGGVPADMLELNGLVVELARLLSVDVQLEPMDRELYLESRMQWRVLGPDGTPIGTVGRVEQSVAAGSSVEQPVAVAEIEIASLLAATGAVGYQSFPRFPAVKRDLSLVVPEGVKYGDVEAVVWTAGGHHLKHVELFDLYTGKGKENGQTAFGIRLKFRSHRGNLKGKTVDRAIENIATALQKDLKVGLRS